MLGKFGKCVIISYAISNKIRISRAYHESASPAIWQGNGVVAGAAEAVMWSLEALKAATAVDASGVVMATVRVPPVHVNHVNVNYRHLNVFYSVI